MTHYTSSSAVRGAGDRCWVACHPLPHGRGSVSSLRPTQNRDREGADYSRQDDGFRKISVEITSDPGKKYRVHSRPGYRPSRGV